ncbi:MAG: ABC transporter ATP-binding protein [Flavobacteriales bacterium]|nr:ABC transporter ATP-binding protein [Flavobacteriales bacterium]
MSHLLEIKKLSTEFLSDGRWQKAIDQVSLKLDKGKVLAIVGESGSGKSVSSLSITQLLPKGVGRISEGQILYEGEIDLSKLSEDKIRSYRSKKIAMIFQEPMTSLNPIEKCGKQVAEVLRFHFGMNKKEAKEKVLGLFDKVELPEPELIYDKYPFEISGGQKQRVMIAIAMACEPQVLIADEPTTALDPAVSASILKLIQRIQKETGMGVIFITHDLEMLRGFADEIAVMYKGKVIEVGTNEVILNHPKEKYTKALLACRPPKKGKPYRLPTVDQIMAGTYSPETLGSQPKKNASSSVVINVDELKVWYPIKKGILGKIREYVKAVDGISFDLLKGETLGLVGGSGSGKTTLGRAIVGLQDISSGRVIFEGKDRSSFSRSEIMQFRKKVQIIFQDPFSSLNPKMTIGRAICEPLFAHDMVSSKNEAREKCKTMLNKVGLLAKHIDRYPHEFSGGQRQRIGIARSLILEPEVIVCDESVSALDVSVQAQVLNLLNDLKDEFNLTYLFISHDMDVVRYFSDRVMHMENGKLIAIGKSEEILAVDQ